MPQTVMAFDFGTKRIGVAACTDVSLGIGTELDPIKARDGIPEWPVLQSLFEEWHPELLIVGLPLASDGSDMEITRRARKFGNRLNGRFGLRVIFVEETLSTREAKEESWARGGDNDYRRHSVDSIAARIILESWLRMRS